MDIPQFKSQSELIEFLYENKETIIAEKKMVLQKSDAISYAPSRTNDKGEAIKAKADVSSLLSANSLKVEVVINTTNLMDSHRDVHFKGIWTKSLNEIKNLYLLQEHQMTFKNIISDEVKAVVRLMDWSELGFEYTGKTQALVFKATIDKDRNPYMFEQYAKGHVKNHSVGMRYVKIQFATKDERYSEEVAVWNKYINQIANKEQVEENGYFWAVTEAKVIEGSAVPMGSNIATPTLSVQNKDIEPSDDTQQTEPSEDTLKNEEETKSSTSIYY